MAAKKTALPLLNADATFECTFGRGCPGVCCQNGRPPVAADEAARIDANMAKFLPHLTEKAKKAIAKDGYMSRRVKAGMPMLRVVDGWCVFFHEGCVLHKVGMLEGDKFRYKPAPCSLFPLEQDDNDNWYVRQHNYKGEQWDLFCLAPTNTAVPAVQSLKEEVAFARKKDAAEAAAKASA